MPDSDLVELTRSTSETQIALKLRLHGSGQANIAIGHYFLKHMLESMSTHGPFDLEISATGDNDHHLIEDVGIALGEAIRKSIPNLKIKRIANEIVPMDDALVLVAVDVVDRPYAAIDLPDPMSAHMLRSLALAGKFTLHVKPLAGHDMHHMVEAAFKGLGRVLNQAIEPTDSVSSTKGEVEWA